MCYLRAWETMSINALTESMIGSYGPECVKSRWFWRGVHAPRPHERELATQSQGYGV